jgi:hypothetical protein
VLYAADELQRWFGEQRLSARDRSDVLGKTPWLTRTFGDIRVEELMVPNDPPNGQALNRMVRRRERTETGFVVGFTSVQLSPAVVFGGRYLKEVASRRAPDLIAETMVAPHPAAGRRSRQPLWSSSPAVTNIVVGGGWFSNTGSGDVAAGIDFRIGRFRAPNLAHAHTRLRLPHHDDVLRPVTWNADSETAWDPGRPRQILFTIAWA